jgi:ABC-type branched-subunit amino acid transport system ATPase component
MKIILLSGKQKTGKSTTFNLLYDKLTQNGTKNIISDKKVLGNPTEKDFECIVTYKGNHVALYSMGDFDLKCIEAIVKYSHCDFLVLAYSEKQHCIIKKSIAKSDTDKLKANEEDCDEIIKELNR